MSLNVYKGLDWSCSFVKICKDYVRVYEDMLISVMIYGRLRSFEKIGEVAGRMMRGSSNTAEKSTRTYEGP